MSDQSAAGIERRKRQFAAWVLERAREMTAYGYPFTLSLEMPAVKAVDVVRRIEEHFAKCPDPAGYAQGKEFKLSVHPSEVQKRPNVPTSVLTIEWAPQEDV